MRKIPHPVERKILQPLVDSDHEVMEPLQHIISAWLENKELDSMLALIKSWVDDLQEMYDKAEKVDDLENGMHWIDNYLDDIDNTISDIRNYTNV